MERLTTRREDGKAIYACSLRWETEDEQTVLDRLAELEDKVESGQLLELPCIKTLTDQKGILYRVYFMNYAWGENGIIDFYTYRSKEAAEARLKELQEK